MLTVIVRIRIVPTLIIVGGAGTAAYMYYRYYKKQHEPKG